MKISDSDVPSGSNKSTGGKRRREQPEPSSEKPTSFVPPQYVDSTHCLAVAKALLTLVLAVDHSCSADLFLMSCKVRLDESCILSHFTVFFNTFLE